jgi:hypothetical protein
MKVAKNDVDPTYEYSPESKVKDKKWNDSKPVTIRVSLTAYGSAGS